MRWVEESARESELPRPVPLPALRVDTAPCAPKSQAETETVVDIEIGWETALERAEESTLELVLSALMQRAAQEHVLEQVEVFRLAVAADPEPEPEPLAVVEVPTAEPEPEPLVPSTPLLQEKPSAPDSPRSESQSRKSKAREYVKPSIQQTHRNEVVHPSKSGPSVGKTQTRMKDKNRSSRGSTGAPAC